MGYVGLDKERFGNYIKELVIMYSAVSKEKAKIYYDHFSEKKIHKWCEKSVMDILEESKVILYQKKKSNWFPTIAEIEEAYDEARIRNIKRKEDELPNGGF